LLLQHRLKANDQRPAIEVIKHYGQLPLVQCFPGQLNQVFMNLLSNAIDALDQSNCYRSVDPHRITITTGLSDDEQQVVIRIQDNGVGIPEDTKAQIFDYLFTTEGGSQRTGLGLAISHQIVVENHGGTIEVNSVLGQGACFVISIPV